MSSSYSAAQSKSDIKISNYDPEKDEVVSKLVMQKIMQDLNAYERLKIEYSEERKRLNQEIERINQQMEELTTRSRYRVSKLEKENERLKKALSISENRGRAYKELAHKKSILAMRMRKYRYRYFEVLSIKVAKMILVMAPFTIVVFLAKDKL